MFAVWTRDDGSVSKRPISCGVQDIPESEIASASFGFAAEDIDDYIFDVLARNGRTYESIEFMVGDNAYVNGN